MHSNELDLNTLRFSVHRVTFQIAGTPGSSLELIANDFAHFADNASGPPLFRIELNEQDPPYHEVPTRPATVYTPRNVGLTEGTRTFVDYSGRALAIWDRGERLFRIYTRDLDLQYEATYLFLLSRLGEELDLRHLHRIHALALGYNGRAILSVLPMGGGKSTLGAHLLKNPQFDFLSDDSPFLDANGSVHAFPLRLGLLPGFEGDIPKEYLRTIQRMEFGPKTLVDYRYFAPRIRPSAEPGIVFLGKRSLSTKCEILPCSPTDWSKSMIVNSVVGLGLYQGLEFIMRSNVSELFGKAGVAWSRWRNARRLCQRSEVYHLILGRDHEHNARTIFEFVQSRLGK